MSSVDRGLNPAGGQGVPRTSGLAIASLVCGLLSLVTCLFTGIPAVVLGIIALLKINSSNGRLLGRGMAVAGLIIGCLGTLGSLFLLGLTLPVLNAAREKGRELESQNNMRIIQAAMLAEERTQHHFYGNLLAEDGRPLLSWRVRILPPLGQKALYEQFHLNEPWDSPHNLPLAAQMPAEFKTPGGTDGDKTQYELPVGEGTIFEEMLPGKLKPGHRDPTMSTESVMRADGTTTAMLVETTPDRAVIWTKPEDLDYRRDDPGAGLNHRGRDVLVGYVDGRVLRIRASAESDTLRKLFSMDGRRFHEAPLTEEELQP
ncbi:MAG TPA: DUF4190 domain-containing protein [Pirellulales bacterium]|nr:DUF4190 domain-containing protein [Pirellulales bacterium]